jgi:hypothetical protein
VVAHAPSVASSCWPSPRPPAPADGGDRLDRFRELAASRLGLVQLIEPDSPPETFRDIYAVLDDEIVDNLTAGGPFASLEFLQDRLDAFAGVWGGASLKLMRAGPVLIGAFMLDERAPANSLRVYGTLRGEPALLTALYREGRPTLYGGGATGHRSWRRGRARCRAGARGRCAWRCCGARAIVCAWRGRRPRSFPTALLARSWSVRGAEVRIRYEVALPGLGARLRGPDRAGGRVSRRRGRCHAGRAAADRALAPRAARHGATIDQRAGCA